MSKRGTIKPKKLLQILVLLFFAINWFNAANASFLCVCPDGHTSIENIYSGECHQDEFENHYNDGIQQNGQHDCSDTVLLTNSVSSSSNNSEIQDINPAITFIEFDRNSIVRDLSQPLTAYTTVDNRPKLSTDSIRLII